MANEPDGVSAAEPAAAPLGAKTSGRKPPRWRALYIAAGLFAVGWAASYVVAGYDPAAGNVVFAVGVFSAVLTFYFWLLVRSRLAWPIRLAGMAVPVLAVGVFRSYYRWEGVNAELVPQFRLRSDARERSVSQTMLEAESTLAGNAVLKSPYADEYYTSTQFFGSNRNGTYPGVELPDQWTAGAVERLWRVPLGLGWSSFAVRDGIAVTLEQPADADYEQMLAIRLEDGKPLWSVKLPGTHRTVPGGAGPRSTPTIHDNLVYGLSSIGTLVAVELMTGKERWRKSLLDESGSTQAGFEELVSWGRSGSPLAVDDLLIVPLGGETKLRATLASFNRVDGTPRWRAGDDQISYSSPVLMTLAGVRQVVYVSELHAGGYDPVNGSLLWTFPWDSGSAGRANVSQPVQIDGDSLVLSKGYFRGAARIRLNVDRSGAWSADEVWASPKSLKTKLTSCVLRDGYLYGLSEGRLECVDAADGNRAWLERADFGHGQVLLVGNQLLISTETGELVAAAAEPGGYRELYRQQVLEPDVVWNIPTLAGDLLLMRDSREAVCLRLPVRGTR